MVRAGNRHRAVEFAFEEWHPLQPYKICSSRQFEERAVSFSVAFSYTFSSSLLFVCTLVNFKSTRVPFHRDIRHSLNVFQMFALFNWIAKDKFVNFEILVRFALIFLSAPKHCGDVCNDILIVSSLDVVTYI